MGWRADWPKAEIPASRSGSVETRASPPQRAHSARRANAWDDGARKENPPNVIATAGAMMAAGTAPARRISLVNALSLRGARSPSPWCEIWRLPWSGECVAAQAPVSAAPRSSRGWCRDEGAAPLQRRTPGGGTDEPLAVLLEAAPTDRAGSTSRRRGTSRPRRWGGRSPC
jgi:hypothetical protein